MNLFPQSIVSWNEPADFTSPSRTKSKARNAVFLAAFMVILFLRMQKASGQFFAIILSVLAISLLLPWAHRRWPRMIPLSGSSVTLYENRIVRRSGRSGVNIMLANIDSCTYYPGKGVDGDYWVLQFNAKVNFLTRAIGVLSDTAIPDDQIFQQVLGVLRDRNIPVRRQTEPETGGA